MKRIQWVAVSVCFVLAVTLWFLVTLNKQTYTTSFDVPVKLTNFPNNFQLLHEFPEEMRVFATGPGIKLLYQDFDPMLDTVQIDFDKFKTRGYFAAQENLAIITQTLKDEVKAVRAEPDTIQLLFAVKSNKRVPVRLDVEFDLPAAYRVPPQGIEYTDSVMVVGPVDSLARIKEVKTKRLKLPHSPQPQVVFVPLDSVGTIQMLPSSIRLRYAPQPYTEKTMKLPMRAVGVPVGTVVHFDPDSVVVKLLTPIDQFESTQSGNISAEIQFEHIDHRSPFVVPRILHVPVDMEIVSFAPQRLRYVVITRE
jgi:hypothetical protein